MNWFKKKKKQKKQNQGNTFIMVVATLSFLAVLVTAILVAVALCYRLKAYDINARDNFYYLEQAMDEIYAGVGADAMEKLNVAYDDTIEVLVYFDAASQSYVTMKNEDANRILKNTYINLVKKDPNYDTVDHVRDRLVSFMTNNYDADSNPEGIQLAVDNLSVNEDTVTIMNLVLKREAVYSTINTRKTTDEDGNVEVGEGDTFVQTITTDLVIGKPEFDINFNTISSDMNDLYEYIFVADKGVEIGNATTRVNIAGNIYAAADFYNKDYNITDKSNKNYINRTDKEELKYAAVSSYDDDRNKACDGKQEKSMYSGIYVDGADVIISANRLVVPGTIAAMNSANISVAGASRSTAGAAEVWADGLVLGGYSFLKSQTSKDVQGAVMNMRAMAYISDDLELNAEASEFNLTGQYYGYNYASLDNRTYTDECVKANGGRTFVSAVSDTIADGATLTGQAHYNSSAIIVNGEDATLDLSSVSSMYIAGQAYIETSKTKTSHNKVVNGSGETEDYRVENKDGNLEAVSYDTVDYPEQSTRTVKDEQKVQKKDKDGNPVTEENGDPVYETTEVETKLPDNYTISTDAEERTNLQDYRTGEAISVKSNQLAYIPNWAVTDNSTGLYLNLPARLRNVEIFKKNWKNLSRIPIIKSVISGKTYYFFDFSTADTEVDKDVMNTFIAEYADMFNQEVTDTTTKGDEAELTNITDYEYFQIKMLKINTTYDEKTGAPDTNANGGYDKIYSNSAITVKNGTSFTIKSKSESIDPLIQAAKNINYNISEQNKYIEKDEDKRSDTLSELTTQNAASLANSVTTKLQSQYKEVKWTLTPASRNQDAVADAQTMEESDITPINYFMKFNKLSDKWDDIIVKLKSGYKVWVCKDNVEVTAEGFTSKDVKGLIICKGDVTFAEDVKSFEGLIITGSKIKVDHSMNFAANAEIVKTILRECDESQQYKDKVNNHFGVCEMFQQYISIYKEDEGETGVDVESTKAISAVQFEDVLSFNNWKKNVD